MPLTEFQKTVLRLLANRRTAESHVGGGTAINRDPITPRYSEDIDIFHDVADAVIVAAVADEKVLVAAGCDVRWIIRQPNFYRAEIQQAGNRVRLDWCYDSAFRFFPVQPDADFGFVLHRTDLAINKLLALAGRSEVRDFVDILYLDRTELSLGALAWAACGKDQGFNPQSLLAMAKRHVSFRQVDLAKENLREPLDLQALKQQWTDAADRAEQLVQQLPECEVGCLYLSSQGKAITPVPSADDFKSLTRHFGSLGGALPQMSP